MFSSLKRGLSTLVLLALVILPNGALAHYEGECKPDFEKFARQVVFLTIDKDEYYSSMTAVWLTPTKVVTIYHHPDRLNMKKDEWYETTLRWADEPYKPLQPYQQEEMAKATSVAKVRLLKTFKTVEQESIAVFELDRSFAERSEMVQLPDVNQIWHDAMPGERLFSVLYKGNGKYWPELQYAAGHAFRDFSERQSGEGEGKKLNPEMLWLEAINRPEPRSGRAVGGHGSSGAPIYYCDGTLSGILANSLTQDSPIGILPTSWGVPNLRAARVDLQTAIELRAMQLM